MTTGNAYLDILLAIVVSVIFSWAFIALIYRSDRRGAEKWNRKVTCRQCSHKGEIVAKQIEQFDGAPTLCTFPDWYWMQCGQCGNKWSFPS